MDDTERSLPIHKLIASGGPVPKASSANENVVGKICVENNFATSVRRQSFFLGWMDCRFMHVNINL